MKGNLFTSCILCWLLLSSAWAQESKPNSTLINCDINLNTKQQVQDEDFNQKQKTDNLPHRKAKCLTTHSKIQPNQALGNANQPNKVHEQKVEINNAEPPNVQPTSSESEDDLKAIEIKLEEERLKVLFVDMNSVVENVGSSMDWTANFLDGFFASNELTRNKAKTWGHFVTEWQPREGEVFTGSSFPIKFKVKAKLPNLENKVELILSDGEDEDFTTLPYESVRTEAFKLSEQSLGAAVRFLYSKSDNFSTSTRIGWGEDQLYTRASVTYRKSFFDKRVSVNIQPAIEYYVVDGWGARFLFDTGYRVTEESEIRYNFSLRDLQSFDSSQWRSGLFHISSVGEKSALIVGISSAGELEPKPDAESHRFSVRYRFNALRSWVFFEIEPFFELHKAEPTDDNWSKTIYSDFTRDTGISLRFEAHYGFL
jgi:hypothetical protein